ncbi:hypothetical protein RUM44_004071 [Polyplax serrata]|uniref:Uncharacterized protein n=1 Tax=Polyplax serrata TaxID=468196 RepID=A0ABR1B1T6_POLSC
MRRYTSISNSSVIHHSRATAGTNLMQASGGIEGLPECIDTCKRAYEHRQVVLSRQVKSTSGCDVNATLSHSGTEQEFTIKLRYRTDKDVSLVNGVRGRRQQETPGGPERPPERKKGERKDLKGGPLRPPHSLTVVLQQDEGREATDNLGCDTTTQNQVECCTPWLDGRGPDQEKPHRFDSNPNTCSHGEG